MDPIQAILLQANQQTTSFPANSRYFQHPTLVRKRPDGTEVPYLKRRFLPRPDTFSAVQEHRVREGDRLDNLTHQYLGDPELFWRVCDANYSLHPLDLTAPDSPPIRVPLPHSYAGNSL